MPIELVGKLQLPVAAVTEFPVVPVAVVGSVWLEESMNVVDVPAIFHPFPVPVISSGDSVGVADEV